MKLNLLTPLALCITLTSIGSSQVPTYSVRFVGDGAPVAINDSGQVVGNDNGLAWFAEATGGPQALPLPAGATSSLAHDVNAAGWVVGSASGPGFGQKAVIWTPDGTGAFAITLVPAPADGDAVAVNDLGEVIGYTVGGGGYAYSDALGFLSLSPLGLTALPEDINNERVLIGRGISGRGESMDLDDLIVVDLGLPTGTGTNYMAVDLNGINDAGDICGRGVVATGGPNDDQAVRFDAVDGWSALNTPVPQAGAIDLDQAGNTLHSVGFSSPVFVYFDALGAVFDLQNHLSPLDQDWSLWLTLGGHISDDGKIVATGNNATSGENGVVVLTPCGISVYGEDAGGANVASLTSASSASVGTDVVMDVQGFAGNGSAFYGISTNPAELPILGGTLLIDPFLIASLGQIPITAGSGAEAAAIPDDAGLVGEAFFVQFVMKDGTAPAGWALTNGLQVVVCS